MGKLKEISSLKRREIARELEKEGPNNYAIMFKGQKKFWKVVRSKKLADKIVSTLKSRGKDAKVVITAAPVTETYDSSRNKNRIMPPTLKVGMKVRIKNIKSKRSKAYTLTKKLGPGKFEAEPGGKIIYSGDVDEIIKEIAKRKVLPDLDPFAGSIKRWTKGRQPPKLSKTDQRFTSGLVTKYTKGRQPAKESTEDIDITEKQIAGLEKKSKESGIPYGILKKVFDRGMAAWKSGHRPGATPHQWAFARVNSFIVGGKTRKTADADLWRKYKGESVEVNEEKEEAVYPHKMYDPKTGKAYIAKTPEDHERMAKLGYTHDDPNSSEKEEDVNEDILKEFKFPNVKKAILFFKKAFRKTTSIPKKISNKIKLYIDSLELEDVEDIYRADIPVVSGLAEIILYTKYNYTANQIQKIKQESVKVRKNKTGMMGAKTQVHKDKKRELSKTAARKKVSMDESRLKDAKENVDNAVGAAVTAIAGAGLAKGISALKKRATGKGRDELKKAKVDKVTAPFDRKIAALDDQIADLKDLISDIKEKPKKNDSDKRSDLKKAKAAQEKIEKLKDTKRKIKDQKRQKKNKTLGIKDSFSLDMQRKLAMVECITGDVDIQIAESITLDSKPSEIKELHKKLHGKNDKGRNQQTR